ncbi:hypothetical protein [Halopelagius longus]|uniref:Uncharacterized protein n=1 Tax=Halopelagius longus TaxID=1236180 RepID=A0A1H1AHT7_9EURY|nr:hypothetical protein [Halopelagius longus]SDQ39323.1 hypothetical protein SAMN05216278_1346 [Halopelagius longus]
MGTDTDSDRRRAYSRRAFLAGVGATTGITAGVGTTAAQETATGTDSSTGTDSPTGTGSSPDRRRGVIPMYEEFSGEEEQYRSQFLLIADQTNEETEPGAFSECSAVGWSASQSEPYEVSVLQRLDQRTEMIKGTNFYTDASGPSFEIGTTWQIREATRCGEYIALTVEKVDPEEADVNVEAAENVETEGTADGAEGTTETVEGTVATTEGTPGDEAAETQTGTPGFGVAATLTGLAGGAAAYLRRD